MLGGTGVPPVPPNQLPPEWAWANIDVRPNGAIVFGDGEPRPPAFFLFLNCVAGCVGPIHLSNCQRPREPGTCDARQECESE